MAHDNNDQSRGSDGTDFLGLLKELALKYALKNAFDYGNANQNAVLGKVLSENQSARAHIKEARAAVEEACKHVNNMKRQEIEEQLKVFTFAEKKHEEPDNLVLPGAEELKLAGKQIMTRFPPEPNGYLHIGHAKAAFLGFESAHKYGGIFLVRFDDTNPEKESNEYVEAILEDLEWLGIKPDKLDFASDHLDVIYKYAEEMILKGNAYVCTCELETIRKLREAKTPCKCRANHVEQNLELWNNMLTITERGKAVLRLKADMQSNNTAMRDPLLARIIDTPHYRQGTTYRVWPTYDLQAPVMDWFNGVTHAIRSKEYELRDESYKFVLECMGNTAPFVVSIARLAIEGYPVSKRLVQPLVAEGKVMGWDDPRLPTIRALRRRGILPLAIKNVVLQFGFSKVESVIQMERVHNENSKLLNDASKRLFFVKDPAKLKIVNASSNIKKATIKLHPTENLGSREIIVSNEVWISSTDLKLLDNDNIVRLKDFINIRKIGNESNDILVEQIECQQMPKQKIQWISGVDGQALQARIIVGDVPFKGETFQEESLKIISGLCEKHCETLNIGEIVQFERFGYCRLDKKTTSMLEFIFSHK